MTAVPGRTCCAVALAAAAVLLAACGTTVSPTAANTLGSASTGNGLGPGAEPFGSSGPSGSSGGGLGGASAGNSLGAGSTPGGGGAVGGVGSPGGPATIAGGGAGAVGTAASASGAGTHSGPGVTNREIFVGLVYAVNESAVSAAGLSAGDIEGYQKAVVNDVNTHGGIAGRQVHPIYYAVNSTSTAPIDNQYKAACNKFTVDNKVFAVMGAGTVAYRQCLNDAGVVQISDDLPQSDAAEFSRFPGYIELGSPNLDRLAAEEVRALADQNYFAPWNATLGRPGGARTKVGVVTYDDAQYSHAVNDVLLPGLRRLGYNPDADVAGIGQVQQASDYSSQAAAVQSAELKFAEDGVNHVIMFEGNGGLSLFFMNQAESQHYHPRYGVNTSSGTQALLSSHDIQADQAVGALGFGWAPGLDLAASDNPDNGPYSNDQRRHCLAVMKQNGITFASTNAEVTALSVCDQFAFLRQTLDMTPHLVTRATFLAAVSRLKSTFVAATTLGEDFFGQRHDGDARIYYWHYVAGCTCMRYTGPPRTIP